jgi:ubiquinone/menaquinone biosynthesis C-methylase UbiE
MTADSSPWDKDYTTRGRIWGGSPHVLPELPAGSYVLEMGSGSGKTLGALVTRSYEVVAIDFSREAAEMSHRTIRRYESGDAVGADARHLPFPAGIFNCVIAFHVIGHMQKEDRMTIALESARILRRGGRLLFRGFSADDLRAGSGSIVEEGTRRRSAGMIIHYFNEEEVLSLFRAFITDTIQTHRWMMRVRRKDFARAEIVAVFTKPD